MVRVNLQEEDACEDGDNGFGKQTEQKSYPCRALSSAHTLCVS